MGARPYDEESRVSHPGGAGLIFLLASDLLTEKAAAATYSSGVQNTTHDTSVDKRARYAERDAHTA